MRLVYTRCADPAQEAAFNRWYDAVHIPDMVGSGLAARGLRYRNAEPGGGPPYLAIYELPDADLAAAHRRIGAAVERFRVGGRMHPALRIVRIGMWRRAEPVHAPSTPAPSVLGGAAAVPRPGGIFIVESRCTDPGRVAAFVDWYDRLHIPDLLATGLFQAAYRFEAMEGQPGGQYLAIYETAGDPVQAVDTFVRDHRPRLKAAGRLSDIIEVVDRGVFAALD